MLLLLYIIIIFFLIENQIADGRPNGPNSEIGHHCCGRNFFPLSFSKSAYNVVVVFFFCLLFVCFCLFVFVLCFPAATCYSRIAVLCQFGHLKERFYSFHWFAVAYNTCFQKHIFYTKCLHIPFPRFKTLTLTLKWSRHWALPLVVRVPMDPISENAFPEGIFRPNSVYIKTTLKH